MTPSGPIRGSWMETRTGRQFEAYRGIRYAEPPVGPLRFQPPQPILNYTSEVDAIEEGPACPQATSRTGYVDEDCLRLNVYTPAKENRKSQLLPVVVYLHAGAFYAGSGRSDDAGPHYLLERSMVFVAVNYRLSTLGLLSTGDAVAPGNNALKDQVAALRWVQRNILAFGGDPNKVTLAGCSVGSRSVNLHMVSPMSRDLFHRAIAMSGAPISQQTIGSDQLHLAQRQASLLDCPVNSTQLLVDCLKTKTTKEICDSYADMFELKKSMDPSLKWYVVIEPDFGQERFLSEQPLDTIRQGRMYSVPYIVSQTEEEFFWRAFNVQNEPTMLSMALNEWERFAPIAFMLPEPNSRAAARRLKDFYLNDQFLTKDTGSNGPNALGRLYSDATTGFAVHRTANVICRYSTHKVFYYEFAYTGNHSFYMNPLTGKPSGAAHLDDLLYLITISSRFPVIQLGSEDDAIVQRMTAIWYNFARYGDPSPSSDTPELTGLAWPPMIPTDRSYLRIDKQFSIQHKLFENRFKIWEELYPIQY